MSADNCVSFQNQGLLDLRAIKTFGVNAKVTKNPIGYFGTGMKYAIAILVRNGCWVEFFIGTQRHSFSVSTHTIRDKDFDIISMTTHFGDAPDSEARSEDLGFTTDLGRNWEVWQAFRELWCNCHDEVEAVVEEGELQPRDGYTTIRVYGEEFVRAYLKRDEVILSGVPDFISEGVEIHRRSSGHIYYKGIRVGDTKHDAMLTYNITGHSMGLTEDRTLGWYFEPLQRIAYAIAKTHDPVLLQLALSAPPDTFEQELDYNSGGCDSPSPEFIDFMKNSNFRDIHNQSARDLYKKISGNQYLPDPTPLTESEQKQLARATAFIKSFGFDVDKDPVVVTNDLPHHIMACVYGGKVFIGRRCFMQGTKTVAHALLEEHIHLHLKLYDETRELQTHLFEMVLSAWETIRGEPL